MEGTTRRKGEYRIGTSGYQYKHWQGVLYDRGLPKKDWFARYAEFFDTVEINNTFYRLPAAGTFDTWREQVSGNFLYALKFSRYGSHLKKLKDPEATIGLFVERASRLGSCLGPILVQLPPGWHADPARLASFLDAAPSQYRWAVEFRDRDWLQDDIFAILAEHKVALCIHDMIDNHPIIRTADWIYLRFHGKHYEGSYSHQYLTAQADRIEGWLKDGHDVYAYFNNDARGHAVDNARALKRYVDRRRKD
jgi:uncharacterized protein YecE (DUF72 family)